MAFSLLMEDAHDKIPFSSFSPSGFVKITLSSAKCSGNVSTPQHRESFVVEFNYELKQTRRSMITLRSAMMMVSACEKGGGGPSQDYLVCI